MSINPISKPSSHSMTRMLQVADPDNNQVISVTHQHFKNPKGQKDITQEDYYVQNPNGSDMSRLLEHLDRKSVV